MRFSARTVVKSPNSGAQPRRGRDEFRSQEGRRSLHIRTRRQMKRTGASPYVSVSDLRRYIQRHMRFSVRTVVKSPNSGAQPRRGRDGFRSQEGRRSLHIRTRRQMKRTGASRYVSVSDLRRSIQRHMRFRPAFCIIGPFVRLQMDGCCRSICT